MMRREFITAETSQRAVDFATREIAKLAALFINRASDERRAKIAFEALSPQLAVAAEADAEFFTQAALAVVAVLDVCGPNADLVACLHGRITFPERWN